MNPDLCARRILAPTLLLCASMSCVPDVHATAPARASHTDPGPGVVQAPVAPIAAESAAGQAIPPGTSTQAPPTSDMPDPRRTSAEMPASPTLPSERMELSPARSGGSDLPQAWTGSQTVADLLRAEVQAQRAPAATGAVVRDRGVRVQAIYGIGRQLMADVSIDGDVQRFRSGQVQARRRDAHAAGEAGESYRLQRIEPPCVVLRRGAETLRTCLLGATDTAAVR